MALIKCKECGEKVSTKAKNCPSCGAKAPKKTSIVTWGVLVLILLAIFGAIHTESNLTPEQRKAIEERRTADIKEKEAARIKQSELEAKTKLENTRKGFHCLSSFDGSHAGVKKLVKEKMRDPKSFEHIETQISPVNDNGAHNLIMKYRAKNGLGGFSVNSASAIIDNESCKAVITSLS